MNIVDVPQDHLHWPARCCRCAGKDYEIRPHTEKVVLWTTLSVTRYRIVNLDIPVCRRCAGGHLLWYGLAIVFGAIAWLLLSKNNGSAAAANRELLLMFAAIACAIVGVRKKPIKVLRLDDEKGTMRIKLYNETIATELRRKSILARHGAAQEAAKR